MKSIFTDNLCLENAKYSSQSSFKHMRPEVNKMTRNGSAHAKLKTHVVPSVSLMVFQT